MNAPDEHSRAPKYALCPVDQIQMCGVTTHHEVLSARGRGGGRLLGVLGYRSVGTTTGVQLGLTPFSE